MDVDLGGMDVDSDEEEELREQEQQQEEMMRRLREEALQDWREQYPAASDIY